MNKEEALKEAELEDSKYESIYQNSSRRIRRQIERNALKNSFAATRVNAQMEKVEHYLQSSSDLMDIMSAAGSMMVAAEMLEYYGGHMVALQAKIMLQAFRAKFPDASDSRFIPFVQQLAKELTDMEKRNEELKGLLRQFQGAFEVDPNEFFNGTADPERVEHQKLMDHVIEKGTDFMKGLIGECMVIENK